MSADDIVSRADSLMRRRRAFVATPPAEPELEEIDIPLLVDEAAAADDEDIPVLTEEVFPDTPTTTVPRDKFDEKLASRLASEFAHSLERRLAAELPTLVEASLAVLEADLRRGILDIANDAIKDFVARREQLRLPLDEPETGEK
ncbi:MAG TPA: hypothetical protein PLE72_06670 [Azospira sp.]|nr:hypothetical protein [Azospira sp.]HNN45530.1 hypothetical protein [Azospira sp.]